MSQKYVSTELKSPKIMLVQQVERGTDTLLHRISPSLQFGIIWSKCIGNRLIKLSDINVNTSGGEYY